MDTSNDEAMFRDQLFALMDQWDAVDGRARMQTTRNAIGCTAMTLLSARRKRIRQQKANALPPLKPEKGWPVARVGSRKWNGTCRRCAQPAVPGHLVAWDPKSGRPSTWQHLDCTHPVKVLPPGSQLKLRYRK